MPARRKDWVHMVAGAVQRAREHTLLARFSQHFLDSGEESAKAQRRVYGKVSTISYHRDQGYDWGGTLLASAATKVAQLAENISEQRSSFTQNSGEICQLLLCNTNTFYTQAVGFGHRDAFCMLEDVWWAR